MNDTLIDKTETKTAQAERAGTVGGWLVVTSAAAPVLLTAGWIVADTLQRSTYSPMEDTVSVLAGYGAQYRWIMTSALFVVVACYLLGAVGLRGAPRRARIGLFAAALAGLGIALSPQPAHGSVAQHMIFTAIGEAILAVWPLLLITRRDPDGMARTPAVLTARFEVAASAVFFVLLVWLVVELHVDSQLGLAERISTGLQTAWPFVVAYSLWREARRHLGPSKVATAVTGMSAAAADVGTAWGRAATAALGEVGARVAGPEAQAADSHPLG